MGPFANFIDEVPEYNYHLRQITKISDCLPSRLQIFPSFLRQPTTSSFTKYFRKVSDINNYLVRKVIDILLRLRNFLGGWHMMNFCRCQGVEETLTLPSRKRWTIALTKDLAGKGVLGMNSNATSSVFDSKTLLTLARTTGSLSSLWAMFHLWSSWRKSGSGSHPFHGDANRDGTLDDGWYHDQVKTHPDFSYL